MKLRIFRIVGQIVFWLSWPFNYVYLKDSNRVRVLVISGQQVALVENWHNDGSWNVPGGGIEKGEEPRQAAVREVQEETGLTIDAMKLTDIGNYQHLASGFRFRYQGFYIVIPIAEPLHGRWPEILQAEWTPLQDLSKLKLELSVGVLLDAWKQQV
jgi:8-oxo-dGTP diphosphatase